MSTAAPRRADGALSVPLVDGVVGSVRTALSVRESLCGAINQYLAAGLLDELEPPIVALVLGGRPMPALSWLVHRWPDTSLSTVLDYGTWVSPSPPINTTSCPLAS